MEIEIQLSRSAIPEHLPTSQLPGSGAWVEFRGTVRAEEDGKSIVALQYDAYSPMAEREMKRILEDISSRHPCLAARIIHRVGVVPIGEAAIYVGIAGRHRAEAFALLAEFMDRLKQDVPIWKEKALTSLEEGPVRGGHADWKSDPKIKKSVHTATEVMELVRALACPLSTERLALNEADGRVLREAVCSPEDQPAFDRSSMDGYVVRIDDSAEQFRVVSEIRAGDWKPLDLKNGEAARIATGGALPGGGLQVVMKEDVRVDNGTLTILHRSSDLNIRFRGEDARAGQVLVEAGTALQSGTVALLASVGHTMPLVTRLPNVLHVATGNEIVPPDQQPSPGEIRDSNSTLIRAFLKQWGIVPEQQRVSEEMRAVQEVIMGRLSRQPELDLLLVSGGASVGEHDFTRSVLEQAGFSVHVSKTSARPGKPLIVAQRGATIVFGLPGNPLSHFVCLNLYVRAALEAWAGVSKTSGFERAILAADLPAGGSGRETFWPAKWQMTKGKASVSPLRWSSSGDLTALATANALIRVPSGVEHLMADTEVEFICTDYLHES